MIKVKTNNSQHRIEQGDILSNVEFYEKVELIKGDIEVSIINFPFVYVLTQDCDLEWDHSFRSDTQRNDDKLLLSVLVVPLYIKEHVISGEHLQDIDRVATRFTINQSSTKLIFQNNNPRYHYLEFLPEIPLNNSIIDFKHYFSIAPNILESQKQSSFICKVESVYREDISQRFAAFLSRIGLPA